jgi:hypothetical protein
MQETIHAAHNLTIQFDSTAWRLFNGSYASGDMIALLEVQPGEIRCAPSFAHARQLPNDGQLAPADVARVVVGWAPESQNWHLGLMLAAQPDTAFRSRWCGLASWPSGQAGNYGDQARQAGQVLARLIDRPFYLVPPPDSLRAGQGETQPIQATTRLQTVAAPPLIEPRVAPRTPPFEFDMWRMIAVPQRYIWQRRRRWLASSALRVVALVVLAGLFLVLGIGSQTRGLARVNPDWLPWLGIVVAGTLAILALANMLFLLAFTDVIIDRKAREVRCQSRFLGRIRWRLPFDAAAYVLLSQTPARPQTRAHADHTVTITQEVWLHLYDGRRFWLVADLGEVAGESRAWEHVRSTSKTPGRRRLKLAHYDTPAHHAALIMAEALNVDVWLDVRA